MDREISKEARRKVLRMQIIKVGSVIGGIGLAVLLLIALFQSNIKRSDIRLSTVDRGVIEISVTASGKLVPAFEEIINSPVNSRIVEVYKRGGDIVEAGTPILKLDLQTAETDYKKLLDEEQMRELQLEQLRINSYSKLSEMEMKLNISRMELNRKEVEVKNEQYLDSLGAGTSDKVRQAELSFKVGQLQLLEEEQKYENEKALVDADLKIKNLELSIFRKSLAEMKRTLEDAQIRSPRKAVLTYINSEIGTQIQQGAQVAIISDLSHFKIEGEIADAYADRIAPGYRILLKIGNERFTGIISYVTPLSRNGVLSFSAQLDEAGHPGLRSGLKGDVYVMNTIKPDVLRIQNATYYSGPGEYNLFVVNDNQLIRRRVVLGESNYDYVELVEGLQEGDEVVVSDMSSYSNKNKLKLK